MRFSLIDRILEIQDGRSIRALKSLSAAEEYLGDHFPGFPVMPGALMIETMTQTAAWYLRKTQGFEHPVVTLTQVSHVRFGHFVSPGDSLVVDLELVSAARSEPGELSFKGKGRIVDAGICTGALGQDLEAFPLAVQARLTVRATPIGEVAPELSTTEAEETAARMRANLERELATLVRSANGAPRAAKS